MTICTTGYVHHICFIYHCLHNLEIYRGAVMEIKNFASYIIEDLPQLEHDLFPTNIN